MTWNNRSVSILLLAFTLVHSSIAQETLPLLKEGAAPQTFEALWAGYDPRAEPLEIETLKAWEEDGVVLQVVRYRIGIFKGQKAMMAAVYGYPKGGTNLPGLVQIHGGGQYADYRAVLTNAKRGYATISIAWAGRISAPGYQVNPDIVKLFWEDKTNDPKYKLTTDWGALDAYHAPCRNPKNGFAFVAPAAWTLDAVESPRNNPWFLVTLGSRRALTFLEQQAEVDADRLGVYGHSMGGKLTVLCAGADARVKAAAPSCGGISNRPTDNALYSETIADDVYLKHITCPIIFLSPSNDFHGHLNDLPTAVNEINSPTWRVTCSAHGNHQDNAAFQITGLLWFDQYLKHSFTFPQTAQTSLTLETQSGVPAFTVKPDASRAILSVDIFYTQHGQMEGEKDDRENTISRFWRHALAQHNDNTWTADLPLISTDRSLWVYANVLYTLDKPATGAGYYYGLYTAETFNVSSLVQMVSPDQIQAAGVRATLKPSLMIETFEGDWEKEWFTYRPEDWARRTHKLYDEQWQAPSKAKLAFEVRSVESNKLVVGIDQYATEIQLSGGLRWQSVVLRPADFHNAAREALSDWNGIKELRLGDQERLKEKDEQLNVGARWQGDRPAFRKLRWIVERTVLPGESIQDASASFDPDKDKLAMRWYTYPEAGTYTGTLNILKGEQPQASVAIPADAAGKQIHVILEVKDLNPIASLYGYRPNLEWIFVTFRRIINAEGKKHSCFISS